MFQRLEVAMDMTTQGFDAVRAATRDSQTTVRDLQKQPMDTLDDAGLGSSRKNKNPMQDLDDAALGELSFPSFPRGCPVGFS